jgi:hypothetical protein
MPWDKKELILYVFMKKLKGFIRQREKPKGSMEEGYISYDYFYYASDYIK